jgi:hypothetical protein
MVLFIMIYTNMISRFFIMVNVISILAMVIQL